MVCGGENVALPHRVGALYLEDDLSVDAQSNHCGGCHAECPGPLAGVADPSAGHQARNGRGPARPLYLRARRSGVRRVGAPSRTAGPRRLSAACLAMSTTRRTPSRPRSWSSPATRHPFANQKRCRPGSTGQPCACAAMRRGNRYNPVPMPPQAANDSDPFAEVAWKEVRGLLDEEVGRLPSALRDPLILCYFNGFSRDEAAEKLGWSRRTLMRRLERARARLRLQPRTAWRGDSRSGCRRAWHRVSCQRRCRNKR